MKKQSVSNVFLNSLLFALLLLSYSKSISARPFAQNQGGWLFLIRDVFWICFAFRLLEDKFHNFDQLKFVKFTGEMVVKADGITHISTFKGVKQDLVNVRFV